MSNTINVQGSYIDVHDNQNVYLSVDKAEVRMGQPCGESPTPSTELLLACVAQVREYFWSDSSMAVIFCVCRDSYGYPNNMRQFEREFDCQEGLLSNTFRNNPYMRVPVGKWSQNGVKERVLRLVDAYKKAVEERLGK